MDLSGCLWLGSGFGYESQWFGYGGLVVIVVWIFWVCSCSLLFLGFEFSRVLNFLTFLGFNFYFSFFPFFFHLVKIYTKIKSKFSEYEFEFNFLGFKFAGFVFCWSCSCGFKFAGFEICCSCWVWFLFLFLIFLFI